MMMCKNKACDFLYLMNFDKLVRLLITEVFMFIRSTNTVKHLSSSEFCTKVPLRLIVADYCKKK